MAYLEENKALYVPGDNVTEACMYCEEQEAITVDGLCTFCDELSRDGDLIK